MVKFNTKINIGGSEFVTNKETALKLYDLIADNVMGFSSYSKEPLTSLDGYNLSLSPLCPEFNEDIEAAKLIGESFGDYQRNKQVKTH